ncbi:histidine phosphatase family protein [Sneathiella sp. HT1-7]|jgi:probable phosphoglycerate mutase|uniref:histidine phosphatase family protein n=1 Tax=Sneathiella sp. HT1-7 TaxID=2887192 RepID=UPI001D151391|nr:histidine phosphatase family protein [Sneathiella sp. HT1-7]MCC3304051.1 histidine phosphatase family protein [Sneathiella sp. HT1-7]
MVRLLVIRHGKTDWNLKKKIQGRTDIPLSDLGRAELDKMRLPSEFAGFNCTSSPLKRTRETAELLGAKNLKIEPALIEMNWGEWEGETLSDLRAKYGGEFKYNEARGINMTPPGGESPADVVARLKPWLQGLEADTIAVTHKGVIRALKSLAYNWDMTDKAPVSFDWATGHLFEVSPDGGLRPLRINIAMEDA